ncbi:MAG TPA: hypothetical protein VN885_10825 [Candidatus Acidoferrales bacterium]|nr:hypothetical protein [Candidatus Acidoferrales bacterium]
MLGRFLLVCLLLIPAIPIATRGCTCSDASPGACPGLQPGDVVFLGTVTAVEDVAYARPKAADSSDQTPDQTGDASAKPPVPDASVKAAATADAIASRLTRYHFRIDERFAPAQASALAEEIDIFSGGEDGDCGYRFKAGQQYVVFTHQGTEGRLFATICSGTRPVSDAKALLPQLRAMRNGQRVASVFGVLRRSEPPFLALPEDPDEPLPNVSLKLRSHDDRFETSSNDEGVYTFYDVHSGEYNFTARLPVRMELTHRSQTGGLARFKIPNGACYEFDVNALPTGHIHGAVLGPDGKPLGVASVELYRAGTYNDAKPGLWGFQGAQGQFDLDHVGPGEYILVFNRMNRTDPNSPYPRAFYPGVGDVADAMPITLKDGQQLSKVNMTVKDGYPTHLLRVQLKWQGVRLPGSVTIMAKADNGENPSAERLADGSYQFTLLESANYTIYAWDDLTPRRPMAARHRGSDSALPARMDAHPVSVAGADKDTKTITLTFVSPIGDKPGK